MAHLEKSDKLFVFYDKLKNVSDDDRSVVILTNGFLELIITTLIEEKCKNKNKINSGSNDYSYSIKLVILNEMGVIKDDLFDSLDWLRELRNKFAHNPLFELKTGHKGTIKEHIQKHSDNSREVTILNLCYLLLALIWNPNKDILIPEFTPSLKK